MSTLIIKHYHCQSSQAENYAFASKERDVETGLSYFGARYYSSELSIWLSVDPMVDKYPSFSPYTYCADNPIKLVDPNGEDIITVDQQTGKTTITKQAGNDVLVCGRKRTPLSGNGVYAKAMEAGAAISNEKGTLLSGMSQKDSRDVFNFMADNTNVEWGYLETQKDDGSSSFMVGSAHDSETESLVFGQAMSAREGSVLRYDHNHLRTDTGFADGWPSTPENKAKEGYVDTDAWKALMARNPNVTLGIRHRMTTTIYIRNGEINDNSIKKYMKR